MILKGLGGSNPILSSKHIWTPPACKGLKCRHALELGCSHISGLLVGRQMKPWALMDFRALLPISRAASDGHGC